MLVEFLYHLFSFDFIWIFELIIDNLPWVFAMLLIGYFYWGESKALGGFFFITLDLWMWMDFERVSGMVIFAGSFLVIYYITKFVFLIVAEELTFFKHRLVIASTVHGFSMMIIYNIFLR